MLKEYKRPFDKINEWVKQQVLIPVKRGVFVAGPSSNAAQPEPYLLANHLLGPSYVSMEAALSYWHLIPEQVFEISSATTVRSKTYQTAVGRFSYTHLPLPYYSFGQQAVELATNQVALVATPEKALCDKIVTTSGLLFRSAAQITAWLIEDMRMDKQMLRTLNTTTIGEWLTDAPKKESLQLLVNTLDKL
ncbi:MAG: hypothetical protein ABIQ88_09170 [Chitinophagaceae bacterium]